MRHRSRHVEIRALIQVGHKLLTKPRKCAVHRLPSTALPNPIRRKAKDVVEPQPGCQSQRRDYQRRCQKLSFVLEAPAENSWVGALIGAKAKKQPTD